MFMRMFPTFSESRPSNLRSQPGRIVTSEFRFQAEEDRRRRGKILRTLNVYENTAVKELSVFSMAGTKTPAFENKEITSTTHRLQQRQ